ncbi:LysR family transcriptional regulator [Candidimonas nitroreducens]|uniref:LysR family transcriptional regulator n=1 Tax=Candidimonas nitroreducens TaxID=683354 RepID=A0A225MWS6_9BURK|nr:LysR family transcriptional regulator [Candidimonas nitroreducens]OWT65746.1 LysR family transcriptional regulator [Candidimonas nitroreducens]
MDKFKQLESFVSVAKLGSLSAAARAEGIAPAMMGRRLDALEARLGTRLLLRSTRRLLLTDAGQALLEEAQRILSDLHDTEARITQGSITPAGHLRISAPRIFGRVCVAPLVPQFTRHHPQITVALDLSDRKVDVTAERYDCAIRLDSPESTAPQSVTIAESRRIVVAAPAYLQAHGTPDGLEDLQKHNCLSVAGHGHGTSWVFRHKGRAREVQVGSDLASNDEAVLLNWALAGCGLLRCHDWEARDALEQGRLVSVLDDYAPAAERIHAVTPEQKYLPPRLQTFLDLLRQHCGQAR